MSKITKQDKEEFPFLHTNVFKGLIWAGFPEHREPSSLYVEGYEHEVELVDTDEHGRSTYYNGWSKIK